MITLGISNVTQNSQLAEGTDNVVDSYTGNRVHDIANSMSDIVMMRLGNTISWRAEEGEFDPEYLFGGSATFTVLDAVFEEDTLIEITVTAEYDEATKTIRSWVKQPTDGLVPPVVRGAWTANSILSNTISDMYIDGRNHGLDQLLIPNSGKPGISSSVAFVNLEGAAIGGTNNYVDYPMTFPANDDIIEDNYDWEGGFPTSPDEILGYPDGTLKAAAETGMYGSQYLPSPKLIKIGKFYFIDELEYPLQGITYIEINSANKMELQLEETGNSGILVIDRINGDALLRGIKFDKNNSDGLFTGIIVTDYSFHHHIDILGTVIQLSETLEDSDRCNGNDDHWVKYSSASVEGATEIASRITGLMGSYGYGFGKKRLDVEAVYE
jgi:hypothetical protein